MNWTFRQAMTWMHTWLGLVLGFVLMVVFFFGSLSVFDREIDRWAIPQTRFEPQPMPSFDQVLRPLMAQIEPSAVEYAAKMPLLHDATWHDDQPLFWRIFLGHGRRACHRLCERRAGKEEGEGQSGRRSGDQS